MSLSVLIPAYNEQERLRPTLERVVAYLEERGEEFEVLVIDDGSRDGTMDVAESFGPPVKVLSNGVNQGKGAALRRGAAASRGSRLLMTDADLSTPIEDLEKLEPHLETYAVVLGSRAVAASNITQRQPLYREMMGKTFNLIIRTLGVGGFRDTQCGFKLLRGDVGRSLFSRLTIDRFAFDVELVWLARRLGHAVCEVGITWSNSEDSRVHAVRDSSRMLWDVVRFRWRHRGLEAAPDGHRSGAT